MLSGLFIVSSVSISKDLPEKGATQENIPINIEITKADGKKCQRCWNYNKDVGKDAGHPGLCPRCMKAVENIKKG